MRKKFDVELDLEVRIDHYRPARQAPACSNPSDPGFSDPGDCLELEFTLFIGKEEVPECLDFLYDQLFYDILEMIEKAEDIQIPFD